jgi:hypothetical protein
LSEVIALARRHREKAIVIGGFGRIELTMMLVVALAIAWLAYSVSVTFENWPWTVRHTYRSGSFEGVTIGSTKMDVMEQILRRQRQGGLDSVALIDDAGVLVLQERAAATLTADAVQRIRGADHWSMGSPGCGAHDKNAICSMELYFSQDRLLRIVYVSYFGPEGT